MRRRHTDPQPDRHGHLHAHLPRAGNSRNHRHLPRRRELHRLAVSGALREGETRPPRPSSNPRPSPRPSATQGLTDEHRRSSRGPAHSTLSVVLFRRGERRDGRLAWLSLRPDRLQGYKQIPPRPCRSRGEAVLSHARTRLVSTLLRPRARHASGRAPASPGRRFSTAAPRPIDSARGSRSARRVRHRRASRCRYSKRLEGIADRRDLAAAAQCQGGSAGVWAARTPAG